MDTFDLQFYTLMKVFLKERDLDLAEFLKQLRSKKSSIRNLASSSNLEQTLNAKTNEFEAV